MISISRPVALFLGGFTLLNIIGDLFAPGFDANLWWIDCAPLPRVIARFVLLLGAAGLITHALRPGMPARLRLGAFGAIAPLIAITFMDALRFYVLLFRREIATRVSVPLSALICLALVVVAWQVIQGGSTRRRATRPRLAVAVFSACLVGFPLAQMYFFGNTDYRRKADVIVVFGARAHVDGSPSGVLADRVRTACELYHQGLAPRMIFSGGPGDGAIDEPHAMRHMALTLGVPNDAIFLDCAGLNTDTTVHNTVRLFPEHRVPRVLAVSHSYHLPRIKMAFAQSGWDVYTVPARETFRLPGNGRFLFAREVVALGTYYLHPLYKYSS